MVIKQIIKQVPSWRTEPVTKSSDSAATDSQRERSREKRKGKRQVPAARKATRTGVALPTGSTQACALGIYGLFQVHAYLFIHIKPLCHLDSHAKTRVGGTTPQSLPRPIHYAGGHQDTSGKSRPRDRTLGHQELASSDEASRQGEETPVRGHGTEKITPCALDDVQLWEQQLNISRNIRQCLQSKQERHG